MSAVMTPTKMTREEYLAWEELQPERHEYIGGDVFSMSGVRQGHNLIAGNLYLAFRQAFRGHPCSVFNIDMKVQVDAADACFYPDLVVSCDSRDRSDRQALYVNHPWLIAEVLSDSTAAFDRGMKFEFFRTVPTLTHYLLLETSRPRVDLFQKSGPGLWALHSMGMGEVHTVNGPHPFTVPVADLYEGLELGTTAVIINR